MEIVILLVPLGLFLAGLAVAAFMWGLRRGQFEDLESRGWEVVFDDRADRRENAQANSENAGHEESNASGTREAPHSEHEPRALLPSRPGAGEGSEERKTGGRE